MYELQYLFFVYTFTLLFKHRTALKKIRKVLVAQRKRQSINSRNSLLLHLQMKKLNQTIVPLANITVS